MKNNKENKGYIYFVYSKLTKSIYIGSTINMERINIYKSIIKNESEFDKISSYNYYTKRNTISYDLAGDLFNEKNEFNIYYIESENYKYLEKSYIKYLSDNNYNIYNKVKYTNHKYDNNDIDLDIINIIN